MSQNTWPLKFTACINIILGVNTSETFSLWEAGWCFGNSWSAVLVGRCQPSLWHNEYASAKYDTRKPSIFAFSILSSFSLLLRVMLITFLPVPQKVNSFCAIHAAIEFSLPMTCLFSFLLETQSKYNQKYCLNSERSHHTKVTCTDLYALLSGNLHIQGPSQFIYMSGVIQSIFFHCQTRTILLLSQEGIQPLKPLKRYFSFPPLTHPTVPFQTSAHPLIIHN